MIAHSNDSTVEMSRHWPFELTALQFPLVLFKLPHKSVIWTAHFPNFPDVKIRLNESHAVVSHEVGDYECRASWDSRKAVHQNSLTLLQSLSNEFCGWSEKVPHHLTFVIENVYGIVSNDVFHGLLEVNAAGSDSFDIFLNQKVSAVGCRLVSKKQSREDLMKGG